MSSQLVKADYKIFKKLSRKRIQEAKILFKEGFNSGAYYLAGYSIEFALKAYYCKQMLFPPKDTKDLYCHSLNTLFQSCGLLGEFEKDMKKNPKLGAAWGTVKEWSEEARYKTFKKEVTANFLDAINNLHNGVLIWIKKKL